MASIQQLLDNGQALWLDYVDRDLLTGDGLQQLVANGLRGVTSNPTIFHKAITGSGAYDAALRDLLAADPAIDGATLYEWLAIQDIQLACDQLDPVFAQTEGADGFVSLEVSPHLAHDAQATIEQARHLWAAVGRRNLMVKVPATTAGLTAIEALIAEGIHVNVTLLFSVERYAEVFAAHTRGLAQNDMPGSVASVASFFVSRIDSMVDPVLAKAGDDTRAPLHRAAVANAQSAYRTFTRLRHGTEFAAQAQRGARVQRPLWASTSAKDPDLDDTFYVDRLIGPDTVNTVPPKTLDAVIDHGHAAVTIDQGMEAADAALAALPDFGIDLDAVTRELEADGIRQFTNSHDALVAALDEKRSTLTGKTEYLSTAR